MSIHTTKILNIRHRLLCYNYNAGLKSTTHSKILTKQTQQINQTQQQQNTTKCLK